MCSKADRMLGDARRRIPTVLLSSSLGKIAVRRLRPVYQAFSDKLKSVDEKHLGALQSAIYQTQVMRIDIDTPDEAFSIFERTNARGMDLEVADLLKNFLYQRRIKTIREDWNEIVKNSNHSMLRMLQEFRENFVQIEYSPGKATGKLAYVFDRFNNEGRKVGERKDIFYPDSTMFRRHFNVEHIEPQNPKKDSLTHVSPSHINNIGNLAVLTTQLNSWLGNKSAIEKFKAMSLNPSRIAELPALVRMLQAYEKKATEQQDGDSLIWSDKAVDERARALAEEGFQKIWTL